MTQMPATNFSDSLSDSLEGNWPAIERLLMNRPCLVAGQNLSIFKTNLDALRSAMAECYDMSIDKADILLRSIIQEADGFANSASVRRTMSRFWTELTDNDFNMIAGRRSELVSALQNRYHLSREIAWTQVNQFFAFQKP